MAKARTRPDGPLAVKGKRTEQKQTATHECGCAFELLRFVDMTGPVAMSGREFTWNPCESHEKTKDFVAGFSEAQVKGIFPSWPPSASMVFMAETQRQATRKPRAEHPPGG